MATRTDPDAVTPLPALVGTTPLGLLAALGALGVAHRRAPGPVRLAWTDALEPSAVLFGVESVDQLAAWVDEDRQQWRASAVLTFGPAGRPLADLKPAPAELHDWESLVAKAAAPDARDDADLLQALLAEGAQAGKGDSKPTHLHFTAGNQLFLDMVRRLADGVSTDHVVSALTEPWRYDVDLPSVRWYSRGERLHAHRAVAPTKEKVLAVPGADWLGFLGLAFLPVAARNEKLRTTGCSPEWKSGTFTWPLWTVPLTPPVIRSLLARRDLRELKPHQLRALGLSQIEQVPIRRLDQGGYGSFGPAKTLTSAA